MQNSISKNSTPNPYAVPLHIWVGPAPLVEQAVKKHLHTFFCIHHQSDCFIASSLENRQFPSVQWISPEKTYTRQTIEPLFKTLSFSLQEHESYFFILEQAHLITPAVGNSLLKTFEEPPRGYNFILLCENSHQLLPTILSRGIITHISSPPETSFAELFSFFYNPALIQLGSFNKTLEKHCPAEHEIPLFLDQLLAFWTSQLQQEAQNSKALKVIECIQKYSKYLPMPGSAKYFLRALFLELSTLL